MNPNGWPPALLQLWRKIDLDPRLCHRRRLPWHAEGPVLALAEDRYGRPQSMTRETFEAWQAMRASALRDGIELEIISAYRSWQAQADIWLRKRDAGLSDEEILRYTAPPGLSEHHTGRALDLAAGEKRVLEATFGHSLAYHWLRQHAGRFGFVESYPEGNAAGFEPEPWHWCWQA